MSKRIKTVRSIPGVVRAFVHGEKSDDRNPIRTRCAKLWTDGKRLYYTPENTENDCVVGFNIVPSKEVAYAYTRYPWNLRVESALELLKIKLYVYSYVCVESDLNTAECVERTLHSIYSHMEYKAINEGTMTRDKVIADWCRVCHAIGLGHMITLPAE